MIKKIIMLCFAILCIPLSSMAVSLSELQSNPNRYKQIGKDSSNFGYTDTTSIKSIRYSHPFYTLHVTEYIVDYEKNLIREFLAIYNYDYGRSYSSLDKTIRLNKNTADIDVLNAVWKQARIYSGIRSSHLPLKTYSFEGALIDSTPQKEPFPESTTVPFMTIEYARADFAFVRFYAAPFWLGKMPENPNDYKTFFGAKIE